jgi:pimeloyl-ACP methyl ester carboxylesterase
VMLVVSAFMLNVLTPVGGPPKCASWHDPSRHQVRFVTVEDGVRLEVLDWGGHGRPIVLLAGSGNTAHVFDGFAKNLAGGHHVYGITRRGYGASSHPDSGYTEQRLAEDVLRVLDSLRIVAPVLVGHSMAGEELTRLGDEHSDRLRGLVYLDAAADPADLPPSSPSYTELFHNLPEPMRTRPSPSSSDLRSFVAYRDWRVRAGEVAFPESELRNGFECNPDGSVGRFRTTQAIHEAIGAGAQKRDYARIRVPILALFAAPGGKPKYQPKGAEESAAIERYEAATAAFIEIGKKRLQNAAAGVRIVDLPGADHYLFLSNEADVARELSAFVSGLQ